MKQGISASRDTFQKTECERSSDNPKRWRICISCGRWFSKIIRESTNSKNPLWDGNPPWGQRISAENLMAIGKSCNLKKRKMTKESNTDFWAHTEARKDFQATSEISFIVIILNREVQASSHKLQSLCWAVRPTQGRRQDSMYIIVPSKTLNCPHGSSSSCFQAWCRVAGAASAKSVLGDRRSLPLRRLVVEARLRGRIVTRPVWVETLFWIAWFTPASQAQQCQVRVGRQCEGHFSRGACWLRQGWGVESDQASLGGNSLLDCVVYAWFTPAVAESVSQDLRFCVVVDGDVVQLLVQNCTRLWLPVFKKSLDSSCFKQLSVMSHFSSAHQLEIVRVVETSSDAAGESVSQDLWFCGGARSATVVMNVPCALSNGKVDALGSHEQGIISRCDAAMMMLAGEIDELASDVVVYGMVSRSVMSRVCRSSRRLGTWRGRRAWFPCSRTHIATRLSTGCVFGWRADRRRQGHAREEGHDVERDFPNERSW